MARGPASTSATPTGTCSNSSRTSEARACRTEPLALAPERLELSAVARCAEHLLLALSAEPGRAAMTLAGLGVSEPAVRESIERIIGRGRSGDSASLGITPRTKRVLERAVKEAKRVARQHCADAEHVLLALAASDGVARDILVQHAVQEEALRERLASLIEPEAPETAAKLRAPKRRGVRRRSRA